MSKHRPDHTITETRDWARIVVAIGSAIATIIAAIGGLIDRLNG